MIQFADRWDSRRFAIERACTCKRGNRSAECVARTFHVVDSHADAIDALADAAKLQAEVGVTYRVVDQTTGEALR